MGAARNAALELATGDYVCFVDGDDGVTEDYFVRLAEIAERTKADLIRFASRDVRGLEESVETESDPREEVFDLTRRDDAARGFAAFVGTTWAWNACYRREALGGLRFKEIPNGEDILFAAQAFLRAKSACGVNRILYRYRIREGSAVHTISARHLISVCEMSRALKASVGDWKWCEAVRPVLKRKLRSHLAGEVAARIGQVAAEDRARVWPKFFEALDVCAWSPPVAALSRIRSRFLIGLFLVGDIRLRRFVSRLRG